MRGPSGEFSGGGSGKVMYKLSSLGPTGVLPRRVLTLPHCFPFSSLSPFVIGMMLSTAVLVKTGLGTSEPEIGGLQEHQLSTAPSLFVQSINMSSFTQQAPGLFKAPEQGMVVHTLGSGPAPAYSLTFFLSDNKEILQTMDWQTMAYGIYPQDLFCKACEISNTFYIKKIT